MHGIPQLDVRPALVGMVHLRPLPGSPRWAGDLPTVREAALADARTLLAGGVDALLIENMHDTPYLRGHVHPETVAAFAVIAAEVVRLGAPTGIQVLAAANREALGIAVATGASFIRVEAFAYAHVADEGWLQASAGELLRARSALGARVAVWADVQKKHASHAVTADLGIDELCRGTAFCGADGLVITGRETGAPTDPQDVAVARDAGLPVAVGSGVTPQQVPLLRHADALIVGSWLKEDGDWRRPVDLERVRAMRDAVQA